MTINIGPGIKIGTGVTITTPILTATANTAPQTLYTGIAISPFRPLTATGGSNIYNYQISMGSLPNGIFLDPLTGVLSGTPTLTQSATAITFTVYDSTGYHASSTSMVTFTVYNQLSATTNTTAQILETTVAITAFTPLTATGGLGVYTYSYTGGTLPAGLNYNTSTGVLSGTPTLTQSATAITFSVQDSTGTTASTTSTVTFTVYTKITATGSAHSFTQVVGDIITSTGTLTASNGTGSYTYFVSSGSLPGGIILNSSTGILSGQVTAAYNGSFVVSVRDTAGIVAATTSTITFVASGAPYTISVVLVGGGGSGAGVPNQWGGGGGGGVYTTPATVKAGNNYIITIGAGGSGSGGGSIGGNTTISVPAPFAPSFATITGGGGLGGSYSGAAYSGTPQVNVGGSWSSGGLFNSSPQGAGAGGGGAGSAGSPGNYTGTIPAGSAAGGAGGGGISTPIVPIGTVGGGGGGGGYVGNPVGTGTPGPGGSGGGGPGSTYSVKGGILGGATGTQNTGGGGGGIWAGSGYSGGSGIVGIVVPSAAYPGVSATGSYTTSPNPGGIAIVWTGSGTYTS